MDQTEEENFNWQQIHSKEERYLGFNEKQMIEIGIVDSGTLCKMEFNVVDSV